MFRYIECIDGVGEEKLCPDGLLFNAKLGPFAYPCQYPIDVDCSGREQTRKHNHQKLLTSNPIHIQTVLFQNHHNPQRTVLTNMATSDSEMRSTVASSGTAPMDVGTPSTALKVLPSMATPTGVTGLTRSLLVMQNVSHTWLGYNRSTNHVWTSQVRLILVPGFVWITSQWRLGRVQ